jgi:hypothetical protein
LRLLNEEVVADLYRVDASSIRLFRIQEPNVVKMSLCRTHRARIPR